MAHQGSERERKRREEAAAALRAVERDSETIGDSGLSKLSGRLAEHFGGSDGAGDRIERLGRVIGRLLGALAVVALLVHLMSGGASR